MLGGEQFTPAQRHRIDTAVREAQEASGCTVSVHVGPSHDDPRRTAQRLHSQLDDPRRSILVHVDPSERALEIVTGSVVRDRLDNGRAGLVAVTMQSAFSAGALTNGIVNGVQQLGRAARLESSLHTDTP